MKVLSLKLPAGLDARLARMAKKQGISKSALVRKTLEGLIAGTDESPASFAELGADLAGCVEGPKDLSHGKRHMEGYGT